MAAALVSTARVVASLTTVCKSSFIEDRLPDDPFGITIDRTSVVANSVYNYSVSAEDNYPDATFDFCNVTFGYSHNGENDSVFVRYWLPAPADFRSRYLSTGGFAYAINQGTDNLPSGIIVGAVAGQTDGGFGSFDTDFDAVFLDANGTVRLPLLFLTDAGLLIWHCVFFRSIMMRCTCSATGHSELSTIGKSFTRKFYAMNSTKLYSYYQSCSEGGREGWSQVQRYGDEWNGAVIGAPAFRFSFQQTQHLFSNIVEQTLDYYPPTCELDLIVNATINACDPLDGKTDGVVARTDLCKLHFDIDSLVGKAYYCAASTASGNNFQKRQAGGEYGESTVPAQNGTVTAKGVAVAKTILNGLKDSEGRQVYFSYQPTAPFQDATTQYNSSTGEWEIDVSGLGSEFVARFLHLLDTDELPSLDDYTYDTLKELMIKGWQMYADTLQTDWPDLTPFHNAGGKVLHYHGESDPSVPAASSVRYWEAVRQTMYPSLSSNASTETFKDWYRLFLVPGVVHCGPNTEQPNEPWPQTNLQVIIDWVEKGITPVTLNATYLAGSQLGQTAQICAWPLRPLWTGNGTTMNCVYDQASIDTWKYDLDGVPLLVA